MATICFVFMAIGCADSQPGPKDAVVLIIRHAENPDSGRDLSPRGQQRAELYKDYFLNLTVDSRRLKPEVIVAAKDSKQSQRPRLTVEPFADAAKLAVDTRFANDQSAEVAADLRANKERKIILLCWHHGAIPNLVRALGADPNALLPNGKWPRSVYDWVIVLTYDHDGHVITANTRRINEHLLPGDSE